jgi:hypothetical protein
MRTAKELFAEALKQDFTSIDDDVFYPVGVVDIKVILTEHDKEIISLIDAVKEKHLTTWNSVDEVDEMVLEIKQSLEGGGS